MKGFFTFIIILLITAAEAQNCNNATSLGTLGAPGACGSGIVNGATTSRAGTNVGVTASDPYLSLSGCGMASPANDVWYTFVAPTNGYGITITVSGGTLANPNIALYNGTNCNTITGISCVVGSANTATLTVSSGIVPGDTYYIQVSGNTGQSGTYTLSVNAFQNCADCLNAASLTVSPLPVNGMYQPGETVSFCFHIDQWTQTANNWLHGVQMAFGSGWNLASLTTTPPPTYVSTRTFYGAGNPATCGSWAYYPAGETSSATGVAWPAGFYFNGVYTTNAFGIPNGCISNTDGNPGNNFGDGISDDGLVIDPPANEWDFCWTITVESGCNPGVSLSVKVTTSGDGESGAWTSTGCTNDPATNFDAVISCCPPNMSTTATCTGTSEGTVTATPQGSAGPYTYTWSPGTQTTSSITGVSSGTYTVTVVDADLCSATATASVTTDALPVSNAGSAVSFCSGNNAAIGAASTVGYSYSWSPTTGLSSSTASNPTVALTNITSNPITTSYTVTTINTSTGCTSSANVNVTVNPLPTTSPAATPAAICNGQSSTLAANAVAGSGTISTYAWSTGLAGSVAGGSVSPVANTTYTVTVTNSNGCSATGTVAVTVNTNPNVTPTATPAAICNGQSTTLAANAVAGSGTISTYAWSTGLAGSVAGGSVSPVANTTYTVTVTNSNGCSATGTVAVTVNTNPNVAPTATPAAICNGQSSTLAANAVAGSGTISTYAWSTGLAGSVAGGSVSPVANTTYTVTVTNSNGCSATGTVAVTVNTNPNVAPTATPAAICNGQSTTLAANAVAGSGTISTYAWSTGLAGSVAGGSVSPVANTTYTVTVTNSNGCSATGTVAVTVNTNPNVAPTATPAAICNGQSTTLAANAVAGSGTISTYAWSTGLAGSVAGGSVSPVVNTTYTVTVTNSNGCSATGTVAVTVNTNPNVAPTATPAAICNGQITTLAANAVAGSGTISTYAWSTGLAGSVAGGSVSPVANTTYTVTVTNSNGCSATGTVAVTVNTNPNVAPTATPAAICNGQITTLAANAVAGSGTISTYAWSTGLAGSVAGGSVSPVANTTYTVTVTNSNGCSATGTVAVTVNTNPNVAPTATPAAICNGQSSTLAANAVAGSGTISTYAWSTGLAGSVAGGSVSPVANTTYTVTVTNSNGCSATGTVAVTVNTNPNVAPTATPAAICNGQSSTLAANAVAGSGTISTYAWSTGLAGSVAGGSVSPVANTTYTVTVTNSNGCSATGTVAVTVNTNPNVAPTATPAAICNGQSSTLAANAVAGSGTISTYAWSTGLAGSVAGGSVSPVANTTYTVTVTNSNGCSATGTVAVTVNTNPNVAPTATPAAICNGQSSILAANAVSGSGIISTYAWSTGLAGSVAGGSVSPVENTTYTVTVTNSNGCSATGTVAVTVNTNPNVAPTATPAAICNGQSTTLAANAVAGSGTISTYAWSTGLAGSVAGGSVSPVANTTYTVTVTNSNGCSATGTVAVTVNTNPNVAPTATPAAICNGQSSTLAANAVAGSGTISTYAWSTGLAGSVAGGSVSPVANTTYTVTVTNSNGCSATGTVAVTVNTNPNVAPTATPAAICNGQSTTLAANAVAGSGTISTYAWSTGLAGSVAGGSVSPVANTTYTVTVTNSNECSATGTVAVTVNTNPNVAPTATPAAICNGQSTTLAANAVAGSGTISTYAWSTGLAGSVAGGSVSPVANTTYTVTVTNSNGCSATGTVAVTVNTNPNVAPTAIPAAICNGQSTTLAANAVAGSGTISTYAWSTGLAGSVAGGSVSPVANTTYTVTVTNSNGCSATGTVAVTVNTNPNVAPTATPAAICNGQSSTLAANAVAGSGTISTYAWSTGLAGSVAGGSVSPVANTTYTVTVTNSNGCSATGTVAVTVNTNPNVAPTATPAAICNGQSSTLAANAVAGSGTISTYAWSTGLAGSVAGGSVSPVANTTYTVTVTNSNGCSATGTVAVTVNTNPNVAPTATPAAICNGQSTTLAANAVAGSGTISTYAWSTGLAGSVAGGSVSPVANTTYTVTVTNSNGCSATGTVAVTVNLLPTPIAANSGPYCASFNIQLSASGALTYTWSGPNAFASNNQNPVITGATVALSGTYDVTATDANGCSATASTDVVVNGSLIPIASNTGPYCAGTVVQLNVAGGVTFAWSGPNAFTSTAQNPSLPGATVAMSGTYDVTATDANGCSGTASTAVVVNPLPVPVASNTGPYCAGVSIQLSSSGGNVYSWSGPAAFVSTVQNPAIPGATVAMGGTYNVTVTDVNGCSATTSTAVVVNPLPVPVASNTGPYCAGVSIQLSSSGGTVYSWSGPAAFVSTVQNPAIPGATVAMGGTYNVTVTDANGCSATTSTTVVVNPLPVPVASNTGPYCAGVSIQLSSSGGTVYSWSGPAAFVSTVQNPAIPGATVAMSGTYNVTVTDANGCSATTSTAVVVNPLPVPVASNTGPYCAGVSIQLSSSGGNVYSWSGPAAFVSTVQNPAIPGATVAMGGTYNVTVTDANGCSATTSTAVVVNPLPVPVASNTGPYCAGVSIQLSSSGGNVYSWSGPAAFVSTVQNPAIPGATVAMGGTYSVTVTDANGCSATTSTAVVVNPLPVPVVSNTGPYCAGVSIQLSSSGGNVYSWSGPAAFVSTVQNPAIPGATVAMGGTYSVTVTDANGCSATTSTAVVVNPLPVPVASNTGPYCAGVSIQLSSSGGTVYSWSGPAAFVSTVQNPAIPGATVAMGGTYNVTVTDANGCSATTSTAVVVNPLPVPLASNTGPYCAGVSIQLSSSGGTVYSWSGPAAFVSTVQNPAIPGATVAMGGTYNVTVTDANGCSATTSTAVVVNPLPVPLASNTGPYCASFNIQLSASGALTYTWSGPNAFASNNQNPVITGATVALSGTYDVTATDANGCSATASTDVVVNGSLIPIASNTGPYCAGTVVQLNVAGGVTFAWSGPNAFTSTAQNPSLPGATVAMSGTYDVTATDANGCSGTASTAVVVNPLPVPVASNTGPYCAGGAIQLSSSGGTVYSWSGPAAFVSTVQNPAIPGATVAMGGTYNVTVTDANGCSATTSTAVVVNPLPVTVASNTGPYCASFNIQLSASGALTYTWSGPNAFASNNQNPVITGATVAMSGTYDVTATDANGCSATASTAVVVNGSLIPIASNTGPYCAGTVVQLNVAGGVTFAWSGPNAFTSTAQNPSLPGATVAMSGTYDVTATDANGCSGTASTAVVVNPLPVPVASNTGPYCAGVSIQLSSSGGNVYSWSGPAAFVSTVQNPAIPGATVAMGGTYNVTVTDVNGCSATTSTAVVVNPLPVPVASNTGPYCAGVSIQLSSSGGTVYSWSGPAAFVSTVQNPAIPGATVAMGGTYNVTVTDANGCSATTSTTVVVNPLPVPVASNTGPYCAGVSIQLSSSGGTVYSWSGPAAFVSTVQNPAIPGATVAMGGTYNVTVTDANGCSATTSTAVVVNPLPVPVASNTGPYCAGVSIQLSSSGGNVYSWSGPAAFVSTVQNPAIPGATVAMGGTYNVTVTDANGCSATTSTAVVVNPLPVPVASNTGPYCAGVSIQLSSSGGNVYSWSGPAAFVSTVQNPAIPGATVAMGGTYSVTVTDANGCSATTSTAVVVNPLPVPVVSNTGPYCAGVSIQLSSSGGNVYSWSGPAAFVSTVQNPAIPGATVAMGGTYSVTVTDANGCSATTSTAVVVNPLPVPVASNTGPYCAGVSIQLSSSGGTVYSWSGPAAFVSTVQNPAIPGATVAMGGTYNVTVTDANGCSATTSTAVVVNPLPVPLASNTGPYCAGVSIQLSSSGGTVYSWSGPAAFVSTVQNPAIPGATVAMGGTYNVTVTDANGCSATTSTAVVVNPLPVPLASNTGPYCASFNIQLSASGALTYTWSGPNAFASNNQNPVITGATVALSGTYDVTATDANGCSATASTDVVVNGSLIPIASNTGPYCAGTVVQLNVAGGVTFAWSGPNAFTSTAQNPSLPGATVAMSGTYDVTATDANGCSGTASTAVVVNPLPVPVASNTGPYCAGGAIQLSSSGGNVYSWSGPAAFVSTVQNPAIPGATVAMGGTYNVTVTDANGCSATTSTAVVVNPLPVPVASNTGPYCAGGAIQLSSSGGTVYSWSGPAAFVSTVQNPAIPGATVAMGGTYNVTVTDANGCSATASTAVVVNPLPVPVASNTGPYCAGGAIQLSSSGGTVYSWSGPAAFVSTVQNPAIPGATVAMGGTYNVTVTDANGCSATASTAVVVNPLPVPVASNTGPYCLGATIALSCSRETNYTWSGPLNFSNNTPNPSIPNSTISMNGTYTVAVSDANGCSAVASTNVIVNPLPLANAGAGVIITCAVSYPSLNAAPIAAGEIYGWNGPGIISGANTASPVVNANGTYILQVTDANTCVAFDSTVVGSDLTPPAITAFPDTTLTCAVTSALLTATSTLTTAVFVWSNGTTGPANIVSGPNIYYVTATDPANGCTALSEVSVGSNRISPNANAGPAGILGCTSSGISLNGYSTSTGSIYFWSGPGIISGANTLAPLINMTGTYTLLVTDPVNGCTASAQTEVTAPDAILPTANVENNPCAQVALGQIALQITGGGTPYTYLWSNNATTENIAGLHGGTYSVTITDNYGCSTSASYQLEEGTFTVTAQENATINLGQTVQLTGVVSGGSGEYTYSWSPDYNLSCVLCQSPVATPYTDMVYTLQVTDTNGCIAYSSVTIQVNPLHNLYIPNAFTPNGDGNNDYFSVYGDLDLIVYFNVKIFNRWGEKVFDSNDPHFEWDGTYKGVLQDPAVFVYELKATFIDGYSRGLYKGSITLIR